MFEQYSHLLIPDQAEFVPSPVSVAGTIESLVEKGGMPRDATFGLGVLDGHVTQQRFGVTTVFVSTYGKNACAWTPPNRTDTLRLKADPLHFATRRQVH